MDDANLLAPFTKWIAPVSMFNFARHGDCVIGDATGGGIVGLDCLSGEVKFRWDDPVVSLHHHPDFLLCTDTPSKSGPSVRALAFDGSELWRCRIKSLGAIHGFVGDRILAEFAHRSKEKGRVIGLVDGRSGDTEALDLPGGRDFSVRGDWLWGWEWLPELANGVGLFRQQLSTGEREILLKEAPADVIAAHYAVVCLHRDGTLVCRDPNTAAARWTVPSEDGVWRPDEDPLRPAMDHDPELVVCYRSGFLEGRATGTGALLWRRALPPRPSRRTHVGLNGPLVDRIRQAPMFLRDGTPTTLRDMLAVHYDGGEIYLAHQRKLFCLDAAAVYAMGKG
jgi:outer membrane protein assembly factor BamB